MMILIDEVLSPEELAQLRGLARGAPWASGESAGPQALVVKHNLQIPEGWAGLREMRQVVVGALNRSHRLLSAALPLKLRPPNFNRYTPEHPAYGWHIDNTVRWLPDGSALRTDLSATVFLSDPSDYDGGELVIREPLGRRSIRGRAGSVVVYPSGLLHEVTPVTRGERLASYLFMQSLVRDPEQRRLLHEMDLALMDLRSRLGEADAQLVALTGTYHNLLRRWSDT
jgi:PKHD-type hydroxylase